MSNLSQTAANVAPGSLTTPYSMVTYGESVTQGMPLYRSGNKFYQCDANDGQAKAACEAISMTPGATDAPGVVFIPSSVSGQSQVNLGATLVVGETYAVSATKGAICPVGDLTSGQYVSILGVASTTALLDFTTIISNTPKA